MEELRALTEAIDALVEAGPEACADPDSVVVLHRELARLDAVVHRSEAAFEASEEWAPDGARDAAAWLAVRCRLPKGEATRRVRLGRRLGDVPVFRDAWLAGEVTGAQVRAVAAAASPETKEALARDEQLLCTQARSLRFEQFAKALAYWQQLADPDGAEADDEARRAKRAVYLDRSFGGLWLGTLTLDPVSGAVVADELRRLEQELFEADWAEATDRLGREPKPSELARTPAQRRADALVEMATRSKALPDGSRRPVPLFSVLVDFETLAGRICELADGTVVSPGSLVRHLDRAVVERAVFSPGARVEIGATARLFSGATRRAIELRDRVCQHPYCDRPASQCEVDHIVPFAEGGPTTQDNGRLLCGFHNRLRNRKQQRPPPAA